jgi:hypothetical protein
MAGRPVFPLSTRIEPANNGRRLTACNLPRYNWCLDTRLDTAGKLPKGFQEHSC